MIQTIENRGRNSETHFATLAEAISHTSHTSQINTSEKMSPRSDTISVFVLFLVLCALPFPKKVSCGGGAVRGEAGSDLHREDPIYLAH